MARLFPKQESDLQEDPGRQSVNNKNGIDPEMGHLCVTCLASIRKCLLRE